MKSSTNDWETNTKRNTRNLAYSTGAWLVCIAIASFGPELIWHGNKILSISFIGLSVVIGLWMIILNSRYINGLDEMQRKVTMDAMAIALGLGVVLGLSYSLLDMADIILFDTEISHLVIVIGLTYLVATFIGYSRLK